MGMGCQRQVPEALPTRNSPGAHCTGGWVGPGLVCTGLETTKSLGPTGENIRGRHSPIYQRIKRFMSSTSAQPCKNTGVHTTQFSHNTILTTLASELRAYVAHKDGKYDVNSYSYTRPILKNQQSTDKNGQKRKETKCLPLCKTQPTTAEFFLNN